jgi:hypothetical protein
MFKLRLCGGDIAPPRSCFIGQCRTRVRSGEFQLNVGHRECGLRVSPWAYFEDGPYLRWFEIAILPSLCERSSFAISCYALFVDTCPQVFSHSINALCGMKNCLPTRIDGIVPSRRRLYVWASPNPVISVVSRGESVTRFSLRTFRRGCFWAFASAGFVSGTRLFDTLVGIPETTCDKLLKRIYQFVGL